MQHFTLSPRAAQILGVDGRTDLRRDELRAMMRPEDRERVRRDLEQAIAEHADYDTEFSVRRPGGQRIWIWSKGRAVYDADGRFAGMIGVLQDVTAHKRAEQALLEETRALDTINRVGKMLVGELDLDRLLHALTDAATELSDAQYGSFLYDRIPGEPPSFARYTLTGLPPEVFEGRPVPRCTRLFEPTFRGQGTLRSDDVVEDPRYGKSPPYYGLPEGHPPVHSYLAVSVVSRSGEIIGALLLGHERPGVFTARHERLVEGIATQAAVALDNARLYQTALCEERRARAQAASIAEADQRKADFLAMLAHELRNPLGAIANAVDVVERSAPEDDKYQRALQAAKRQIEHQRKLVDELLDLGRISRGKIELNREVLDVRELVRQTVEDYRTAVAAAGLTLDVVLPEVPVTIVGDRVRLAQVIGNLLDNARKFTPTGGTVSVRLEPTSIGDARLVIADTGAGLDPTQIPRLFSPFEQTGRSEERRHGGLGLGLALVKGLVELHHGRIEARSEGLGRGCEFSVTIPMARQPTVTAAPRAAREDVAGRRVLLVEDMPDVAETLRDLLELMGCEVDVAHDGGEALASLSAHHPDVVLCDLGLPDMTGLELARKIREQSNGDAPHLVALTGYGAAEDRRASHEAGFDEHLVKPVRVSQIVDILKHLA